MKAKKQAELEAAAMREAHRLIDSTPCLDDAVKTAEWNALVALRTYEIFKKLIS